MSGPVQLAMRCRVMRIRRDSGPTRGPWTHKEIAYGDFAVEVSADLPPRARELLSERARILGDAP